MTGNLSMSGNTITQLGDPVRDRDAVHKSYVDDRMFNKSGDEMMGVLNMNGWLLHGLSIDYPPNYRGDEAVSWSQLTNHIERILRSFATRGYVDGILGSTSEFVNKNGDQMMGVLNMNGQLLRGLPVESRPVYDGDEAVSWAQLTRHSQQILRPFASREYVDSLRHKPVITLTAYTRGATGSHGGAAFDFNDGDRTIRYHKPKSAGRIIRVCVLTENSKNFGVAIRVDGVLDVIRTEGNTVFSRILSTEFNIADPINLEVTHEKRYLHGDDSITLFLELDV